MWLDNLVAPLLAHISGSNYYSRVLDKRAPASSPTNGPFRKPTPRTEHFPWARHCDVRTITNRVPSKQKENIPSGKSHLHFDTGRTIPFYEGLGTSLKINLFYRSPSFIAASIPVLLSGK